jgi:hypothetical protein
MKSFLLVMSFVCLPAFAGAGLTANQGLLKRAAKASRQYLPADQQPEMKTLTFGSSISGEEVRFLTAGGRAECILAPVSNFFYPGANSETQSSFELTCRGSVRVDDLVTVLK